MSQAESILFIWSDIAKPEFAPRHFESSLTVLFFSQLDIKRSQHGNRAFVAAASANTNTYGHLQRIINHTVQVSGCHNDRSSCPSAAFLQLL